jgi:hypothetical protein
VVVTKSQNQLKNLLPDSKRLRCRKKRKEVQMMKTLLWKRKNQKSNQKYRRKLQRAQLHQNLLLLRLVLKRKQLVQKGKKRIWVQV